METHKHETQGYLLKRDKNCNLRVVASSPPADWSVERKDWYLDWEKEVVDGLRGVHPAMEHIFDEAYEAKPQD